jgi:hypothetical protein
MRNIVAICAAALAVASPAVAQAATFSPDGTYVFTGSVEVKKNLPVWTTCGLTLTINVSGGVATSSASLSGAFPCTGITFTGSPFATDGLGSPVTVLEIAGVSINIPAIPPAFPADSCSGDLYAIWNGSGTPTIEFQDGTSDTPDASAPGTDPNCKIKGTVTQTSPGTPLVIS